MAKAHCTVCDAEVEAIDGLCLLGHPVGEHSESSALDDLRAEIDRAFNAASEEVAAILTGEIPLVPKIESPSKLNQAPTPVARQETRPLRLETPVLVEERIPTPVPLPPRLSSEPTTWQAPSTGSIPPPPPSGKLDVAGMWAKANEAGNDDPINAFAPAPRLDWGPDAKKGLRRRIEG